MTVYGLSVALDVISGIVGFGIVFAMPVLRAVIDDARTGLALEQRLAQRVMTPAMTGSLVTGLYQVLAGPHGIWDAWTTSASGLGPDQTRCRSTA